MTELLAPVAQSHLESLADALSGFGPSAEISVRWGRFLARRLATGGRLLVAGNGGSAAQAQHLSAEIVGRYREDRPPFSAVALHCEPSALTAILNDYGADEVFARQVWAHGRAGDVLVVMSTSGRSRNVLAAAMKARSLGLTTWAMTGPAPNPLAAACDEAMTVPSEITATIQELHLVGLHLLCEAMDSELGTGSYTDPLGVLP